MSKVKYLNDEEKNDDNMNHVWKDPKLVPTNSILNGIIKTCLLSCIFHMLLSHLC